MRKSNGLECENECYENKYNVRTRRTLILLNLIFFFMLGLPGKWMSRHVSLCFNVDSSNSLNKILQRQKSYSIDV